MYCRAYISEGQRAREDVDGPYACPGTLAGCKLNILCHTHTATPQYLDGNYEQSGFLLSLDILVIYCCVNHIRFIAI